jgi:hypothetical protein
MVRYRSSLASYFQRPARRNAVATVLRFYFRGGGGCRTRDLRCLPGTVLAGAVMMRKLEHNNDDDHEDNDDEEAVLYV